MVRFHPCVLGREIWKMWEHICLRLEKTKCLVQMWVASKWWHAFPEVSKEYMHSMWKQNRCWMKTWMLRKAAWGIEKGLGGGIGCQEDRQPKCRLKLCCERLLFHLTCTNQSFPNHAYYAREACLHMLQLLLYWHSCKLHQAPLLHRAWHQSRQSKKCPVYLLLKFLFSGEGISLACNFL